MANENLETLSLLESKILSISQHQYNTGYHNGTFTPGYVRKETGQPYPAINTTLSSLVNYGFLEASKSNAFRDGTRIDIDVYLITDKGLQAIEKIRSGAIKVKEPEPNSELSRNQEPMNNFRQRGESGYSLEIIQSFKNLETDLAPITKTVKELHIKLDKLLASPTKSEAPPSSEQPKTRKSRAVNQESFKHQIIILNCLKTISEKSKFVLANEVYETYCLRCKNNGITPKDAPQFKNILKRLDKDRHITLKTVGCKSPGITGHGSRVVVEWVCHLKNMNENLNGR